MASLELLQHQIRALGSESAALKCQRFFKTGPGEYAEKDRFLGVSVPQLRALLKSTGQLSFAQTITLLHSPWHEERLFALLLMVRSFRAAPEGGELRDEWCALYLENLACVNNWDLVDSSAAQILGTWMRARDRSLLETLVASSVLWERRVAVVATHAFIQEGDLEWTFRLVRLLLKDSQDLMHKACGWMLREAYKKEPHTVLVFLQEHSLGMPRTMLRYAIERVPVAQRRLLLQTWGKAQ